jgi:hypothetical protein
MSPIWLACLLSLSRICVILSPGNFSGIPPLVDHQLVYFPLCVAEQSNDYRVQCCKYYWGCVHILPFSVIFPLSNPSLWIISLSSPSLLDHRIPTTMASFHSTRPVRDCRCALRACRTYIGRAVLRKVRLCWYVASLLIKFTSQPFVDPFLGTLHHLSRANDEFSLIPIFSNLLPELKRNWRSYSSNLIGYMHFFTSRYTTAYPSSHYSFGRRRIASVLPRHLCILCDPTGPYRRHWWCDSLARSSTGSLNSADRLEFNSVSLAPHLNGPMVLCTHFPHDACLSGIQRRRPAHNFVRS